MRNQAIIGVLFVTLSVCAVFSCGQVGLGPRETGPFPQAEDAYTPASAPLQNIDYQTQQDAAGEDGSLFLQAGSATLTVPPGGLPAGAEVEATGFTGEGAVLHEGLWVDCETTELAEAATITLDLSNHPVESLEEVELHVFRYEEGMEPTDEEQEPGLWIWSPEEADELGVNADLKDGGTQLEITTRHFSGYSVYTAINSIVFDIPRNHLKPGDIVFRLSGNYWTTGHVGLISTPSEANRVVHSFFVPGANAQPGPAETDFSVAERSFMGASQSGNIYMGARRPDAWTESKGNEALNWARTKVGRDDVYYQVVGSGTSPYSWLPGGYAEIYSCSGLVECAYRESGSTVSGKPKGIVAPLDEFLTTSPVDLVQVERGESYSMVVNFISAGSINLFRGREYVIDNSALDISELRTTLPRQYYEPLDSSGRFTVYTSGLEPGKDYCVGFLARKGDGTYAQNFWIRVLGETAPQVTPPPPPSERLTVGQISGPSSVDESSSASYGVIASGASGITFDWSVAPSSAGSFSDPTRALTNFTASQVEADTSATIKVVVAATGQSSVTRTKTVTVKNVTTGEYTYAISGTVAKDTGGGLEGVVLTLAPGTYSATTNSSGAYTITGVPNGSYTLTPSKSGWTFSPPPPSVIVNNGNVSGRDFTASSTDAFPQEYTTDLDGFWTEDWSNVQVLEWYCSPPNLVEQPSAAEIEATIDGNRFRIENGRDPNVGSLLRGVFSEFDWQIRVNCLSKLSPSMYKLLFDALGSMRDGEYWGDFPVSAERYGSVNADCTRWAGTYEENGVLTGEGVNGPVSLRYNIRADFVATRE